MKTFVKYFLFLSLLNSGFPLEARAFVIDTLSITEVKVVRSRTNYYREDLKSREIDSASIHRSGFSNLGELLMSSGTSNVLSYGGDGSISTVSIRGSGSSHTSVLWNGFPLNSLTTGIADLSLIPVSFFNSAKITSGSSGSLFGSGTFGGTIDLARKADWKKRLTISAGMELGSFGSYKPGLRFGIGNTKVQYDLNFSLNHVVNNFPYTDFEKAGQPTVISSHNLMKSMGLIQNIQFLLPKNNMLQVGIWYFVKHNELPLPMGSYGESLQSQTDSSLKVFLKWRKVFQKTSFEVKAGYLFDHLRFVDEKLNNEGGYSIDSRISSRQVYLDFNSRFFHFRNFTIDAGGNISYLSAEVAAYNGQVSEYRANLIAGAQYRYKHLKINGSFRLNFNPYHQPPPLLSIGANYELWKDHLWIKGNVSNKYRLPGFNDRYWQPGGNPDLMPEQGWSTDLGTEIHLLTSADKSRKLNLEINVFSGRINNWIQWSPGPGYWSPVNFKNVWNRGMELDAYLQRRAGDFDFLFRVNYSLTYSTVEEAENTQLLNKQLRYTPKNVVSSSVGLSYLSFYSNLDFRFSGKRYTTEDNDPFYVLDPYYTLDLTLGYKSRKFLRGSSLQLKVRNLTNEMFQVIRSYPMPGRAWYLSLIFTIDKK